MVFNLATSAGRKAGSVFLGATVAVVGVRYRG